MTTAPATPATLQQTRTAAQVLVVADHPAGQVVAGPCDYATASVVAAALFAYGYQPVRDDHRRGTDAGYLLACDRLRRRRLVELAVRATAMPIQVAMDGPGSAPCRCGCGRAAITVPAIRLPLGEAFEGQSAESGPQVADPPPPAEAPTLPPWAVLACTRLAQAAAIVLAVILRPSLLVRLVQRRAAR